VKIRPRLLAASLAIAVVVSLVGGYLVSRSNDTDAGTDAVLDEPGEVPEPVPSLATIPDLSGDRLPVVDVYDADGQAISTASLLGQPMVVNFWYSTCVPCAKELADFADVHAEVGDEVRFVGLNPSDAPPVMERFAGERGVEYELLGTSFEDVLAEFDIAFFPYTLFVAADGTIVEQTGVLDADGLRSKVDNLLEYDT
jgi:peroxiredoxin